MNSACKRPQYEEVYDIMNDLCSIELDRYEEDNIAIAYLAMASLISQKNGIERHNFLEAAVTLYDELYG